MNLPDISSYEEAKEVFNQTTAELREKNKLDETELPDGSGLKDIDEKERKRALKKLRAIINS